MKWTTFFIVICFFCVLSSSAQINLCQYLAPQDNIKESENSATITNYLSDFLKAENGNVELSLIAKTESPNAFHYLFQQHISSIPIVRADVKINITKSGKIISIYSNLVNTQAMQKPTLFPENELFIAYNKWKAENETIQLNNKAFCFIAKENTLIPAIRVRYYNKNKIANECIIDINGALTNRITSVFFTQDSMVTGKVFNPDPLTSAGVSYGGAYQDYNDSDIVVLNNQRQTKSFKAEFDGSLFRLKNQYIELRDNDGNAIIPATSASPVFDFTRHQTGFEDVNAFYHLSLQSNYIRALGFNASSQLVYPDPHGGIADNSFFNEPNTIYFGTGGVDDAEDADVLIHEYSHFVSYSAAPSTNTGQERNSIDEGTCDYFAASYSKAINSYNWTKLFNWDGNPPFWNGRVVNTTKHYPQNISNNIYKDGELWSATLMQIHDVLGRATTDSLVLQTMFLFAANMTYPQAAQALLTADTLITGGRNFCVLYNFLYQRGYLPLITNSCGVNNIENIQTLPIQLVQTPNGFSIESKDNEVQIKGYEIIDAIGKNVYQSQSLQFDNNYNYSQGLYLVHVETNAGNKTFKVVF